MLLTVLPLFHTGGLNVFSYPALHVGGTVLIMRNFDPGDALRLIGDPTVGVTHMFGVPANYQFMAQHPHFRKPTAAGWCSPVSAARRPRTRS